ncbi:MAG: CAP domain-containing protein [Planctomycetota bacterium]|jgi:uncharacterized protein YkwD
MARLRIQFRGAETVVHLGDGETTVGRSNRCTINLPDPGLAEIHFRLRPKDGGYRIKDDGSGIGTRVNGKEVFATSLEDGDVIEAGALRCEYITKAGARKRRAAAQAAPPAPAPAQAPEPAAPAPARPARPPVGRPTAAASLQRAPRVAREPKRRSKTALALLAVGGVAAVAIVAFMLSRGDGSEEAATLLADARASLQKAEAETDLEALAGARASLDRIRREFGKTKSAASAETLSIRAERLAVVLETLNEVDAALAQEMSPERAQTWFRRLAPLVDSSPPSVQIRLGLALDQLREAERARAESAYRTAAEQAQQLVSAKSYGKARAIWLEYQTDDAICRQQADDALRVLETRIAKEYRALLRLAARAGDTDGRIGLLEASRETFRRTPQADDLEVRISALHARKRQAEYIVVDKDSGSKKDPAGTDAGATPPVESGPYVEPDKVMELVKARRYAAAASMLASITRHPLAKVHGEELTLLAALKADLVAQIESDPAKFAGIRLPGRDGRADAAGADAESLRVKGDDGEKTYAWKDLPAKSFVKLFRQAGFNKPPRLAVALFYDGEMLVKEADRAYVDFFESEQAPSTFTRVLARRRGITPPAGGFVLFRKRIVTPAERDKVVLAERIAKLVRDAGRASEKRRLDIWAELEKIGTPALQGLAESIGARRKAAVEELVKSKAFGSGRYSKRFGPKLLAARKQALAFILNPQLYPYPNKSEAAQKRAEALVEKVRALWEEPYPLMLEASESATALDAEIAALDERLARVDPLAEPVYESAVAAVLAKLDVRTIPVPGFSQGAVDYNLAVEKYNRELQNTTVQPEERANVDAVNKYRWMMGLNGVKIDERLVRAARKHSIEMQEKNYFAHNSRTPHLRTPGMRAQREGYSSGVGENIARGASTGVGAFWQWFRSSGHHRNMLSGWTDLGCGACKNHWWTQKFGRATGKSLSPPRVPPDPDPPGSSGA